MRNSWHCPPRRAGSSLAWAHSWLIIYTAITVSIIYAGSNQRLEYIRRRISLMFSLTDFQPLSIAEINIIPNVVLHKDISINRNADHRTSVNIAYINKFANDILELFYLE